MYVFMYVCMHVCVENRTGNDGERKGAACLCPAAKKMEVRGKGTVAEVNRVH